MMTEAVFDANADVIRAPQDRGVAWHDTYQH